MADYERPHGFENCWTVKTPRSVRSKAAGYYSVGNNSPKESAEKGQKETAGKGAARAAGSGAMSASDKATLGRVVRNTPEVMVKVTRPSKTDKSGNEIKVNRSSEGTRVSGHMDYISRNGKIELEASDGQILTGKEATGGLVAEWLKNHDEDRENGFATDRTRITTSMVLSMPAQVNAEGVRDAVRSLAEDEFGGRHDFVMALHTDTKHPHVHLTVRTVGHDGIKLNLRKADLQHLRDQFAQRLRKRGIEAEATPRHARGIARKSSKMAVYKVRQKGQLPNTEQAKREEVQRDMNAHGGRLPDYPWDRSMMTRRNNVIGTYMRAATALAQSNNPEDQALARDTERFAASLTGMQTERSRMATEVSKSRIESRPVSKGFVRSRGDKDVNEKSKRGPEKGDADRER